MLSYHNTPIVFVGPIGILAYTLREMVVRRKKNSTGTRLVLAMRYRKLPAAIDWLCAAFGFEKHHVGIGDDGEIFYAHLTLGDDIVMVRSVLDSHLDKLMKQPDEIGGVQTQSCYFVVDDADAHYRKAKAAGAGIVVDISDDDHGGRGYSCRDPEGHVWSFGTYDPWQRGPLATSRGHKLYRPAIVAAMLGSLVAAATAGWMLPRSAPAELETRVKFDEGAAREHAEKERARANLLATELARERGAKDAAERAVNAVREQLAREQDAKKTAERNAQQLERQVTEERRAKEVAERTAKAENERMAGERIAREVEQRGVSDTMKELTRERDAKQRAERQMQDALEQLARERRAKEEAERAAKDARDQLAEVQKANATTLQPEVVPPTRPSRERKVRGQLWDCRPRPPTGEVACRPIIGRRDP